MLTIRVVTLAAILIFSSSATEPPKRLALIIGNAEYTRAHRLPNAARDALAISRRLRELGFDVQPGTQDLKQSEMRNALSAFGTKVQAAGPNVIAFVYYSGHASQDAYGVNYLLPVDADASSADAVRQNGVPITPLIQAMEDSNNSVNVLVLDACRRWFRNDRRSGDPRGLRDLGHLASFFIVYATRTGEVADEGPNLNSSPFSRRLIEALNTQAAEPISLIFDDVQTKVYGDTDKLQLPVYVNGLVRAGRWALSSGSLDQVRDTPKVVVGERAPNEFLSTLDRGKLLKFTKGNVSFVDVLLRRRDLLEKYSINNLDRLAFFLAAVAFESSGFRQQSETFSQSPEALRRTFTSRIPSDELAKRLAGRPEEVANLVYAGRFGNGPSASGDGWRYRGRGIFFITGKDHYRTYGRRVGVDLVSSPDLANDIEVAFAISAAIWYDKRANGAADQNNMAVAVRRFRGSSRQEDMPGRLRWLAQARQALEETGG